MVSKPDSEKRQSGGTKMILCAIDIGGTFIKFGKYNLENNLLTDLGKVSTPHTNQESLINTISDIVGKFSDVQGCAISLPGTIDSSKGFVNQGGALQYNNQTYFAQVVADKIGLPVTIENDAICAVKAELWQGKLVNVNEAIVLVLGTGLGCGIVHQGEVIRGVHGYAGEFSMILTKDLMKHGKDAVLGEQVGIPGFVRKLSNECGEELDGLKAFDLIASGDEKLLPLFDEYLSVFSRQLFNYQIMLDPEVILIGGGISQNKYFMDRLIDSVEQLYSLMPFAIPHKKIEACAFQSDANLIGAIRNYVDLNGIF